MNAMRMALSCALVGWMAAGSQAQSESYCSPDPIPLRRYAPQYNTYVPAVANRASYGSPLDNSVPTPSLVPGGSALQPSAMPYENVPPPPTVANDNLPPPPAVPYENAPPSPAEGPSISPTPDESNLPVGPLPATNVLPPGGYLKDAGNCDANGNACDCGGACLLPWYASINGLYMTRSQPNTVYTTAAASDPATLGSFSDVNWTWGLQGTLGYRFCCDWAVEGTYWGLAAANTDSGPSFPGPYNSLLIGNDVTLTGGSNQVIANYSERSPDNHVWRTCQTQNAEIDFVRTIWSGDCNRFGCDFLVGARWFRFQDGFVYGAESNASAGDWLYLNDRITNDLIGLQAGFNASCRIADRWKVFFKPLVGGFDNHMTMDYNLYAVGVSGSQYQAASSLYTSPNYPIHATSDGFAFLTQVDLGVDCQVTRHLSIQAGYRVVAVSGLGLADGQIPSNAGYTQSLAHIQHAGSLLLDGEFGGVTFTW